MHEIRELKESEDTERYLTLGVVQALIAEDSSENRSDCRPRASEIALVAENSCENRLVCRKHSSEIAYAELSLQLSNAK